MKTDLEKANAIFSYVQKTFTWNKDRGVYTEDGIKKLLETKVGNAAEINLFLVMMLREAGLKSATAGRDRSAAGPSRSRCQGPLPTVRMNQRDDPATTYVDE